MCGTLSTFFYRNTKIEERWNEAYTYLDKAGATFGTPIERLQKMNAPAIELYKSKGVDLYTEYLPTFETTAHKKFPTEKQSGILFQQNI